MAQSAAEDTSVHSASPSEALRAIGRAPEWQPLVVDFDGTLFMRNSTEEYLNCLRPRQLGLIVLLAVDVGEPWRWLPRRWGGGAQARDWLRVLFATLLLPWTPWLWRRRAERLAADHGNAPLVAVLRGKPGSRLVVASRGLRFIIQPLLESLLTRPFELVASPWWRGACGQGKVSMIHRELRDDVVDACVIVDDPSDDTVLLAASGAAYPVQWPQMRVEPALDGVYAPLYYTQHVKRRGRNVVLQTIVAEDFVFWLLATTWLSAEPWLHGGGLGFLLLSFWCVYEIGYKENDLVAARFEKAPTLSDTFVNNRQRITFVWPWFWAVGLALPGLWMLEAAGALPAPLSLMFTAWLGLLVGLRITYMAFNHANKPTRVWIFPLLQAFRSFAPLLVTATNYLGVVLLMAHVMARSTHYFAYRIMGDRAAWPVLPTALVRLLLVVFMLFAAGLASDGVVIAMSWQLAAILAWCGYRARRDIVGVLKGVRPIWRDG